MDWERFTNDQVEKLLALAERKEAEGRGLKLEALEVLDARQVFTADGCHNLSEWYAARVDIGLDTARSVVRTMRRTADKPWLREALAAGAISFDRAEALSRIPEDVGTMSHLDVAGVRRAAADLVEITREDEVRSAEDQYFVMQPALDKSWWKTHGGLEGVVSAALDQVLTEKADSLPDLPDGSKGSPAWRQAIALYQLATGGQSPQAHITVFVDAKKSVETNGQTGMRLEAGPRVGQQALHAVFCDSVTEVTVNTSDGIPMRYGRRSRGIPPQLRRATLSKNHSPPGGGAEQGEYPNEERGRGCGEDRGQTFRWCLTSPSGRSYPEQPPPPSFLRGRSGNTPKPDGSGSEGRNYRMTPNPSR